MVIGKKKLYFVIFIFFSLYLSVVPSVAHSTLGVITEDKLDYSKQWITLNINEHDAIFALITKLKTTKTGKKLLSLVESKAQNEGYSIDSLIVSGENSLCDTTLIRKFSAKNPTDVNYKTSSKIYLNKYLNTLDAILDLAHEMTHYVFRGVFNPYRSDVDLLSFIKATVEGEGGEVDAFMVECKVKEELLGKNYNISTLCQKLKDPISGEYKKELGIKFFYQVGDDHKKITRLLEKNEILPEQLVHLSKKEIAFVSSQYGHSYPLAAIYEYKTVMQKVCENDFKRISLLKSKLARAPASNNLKSNDDEIKYHELQRNLAKRCSNL